MESRKFQELKQKAYVTNFQDKNKTERELNGT